MTHLMLWDGKSYDREEVNRLSPLLVDYASKHPVLEERVFGEPDRMMGLRDLPAVALALVSIAYAFFVFLGGRPFGEGLPKVVTDASVPVMVLVPQVLIGRVTSQKRMWLRVCDGMVSFIAADGTLQMQVGLGELKWFRGFLSHDPHSQGLRNRPCIGLIHRNLLLPRGRPFFSRPDDRPTRKMSGGMGPVFWKPS